MTETDWLSFVFTWFYGIKADELGTISRHEIIYNIMPFRDDVTYRQINVRCNLLSKKYSQNNPLKLPYLSSQGRILFQSD